MDNQETISNLRSFLCRLDEFKAVAHEVSSEYGNEDDRQHFSAQYPFEFSFDECPGMISEWYVGVEDRLNFEIWRSKRIQELELNDYFKDIAGDGCVIGPGYRYSDDTFIYRMGKQHMDEKISGGIQKQYYTIIGNMEYEDDDLYNLEWTLWIQWSRTGSEPGDRE